MADDVRIADVIAKRRMQAINRAGIRSLIIRVVCLAAIAYLILTYGFLITQCHGQNMFPAMKDGDLCIVFRREALTLFQEPLKQDDVIAYQANGKRGFGRVIAVAGDVVMLDESGNVSVNGVNQRQDLPFPTYPKGETEYPIRVPDGCVYVLGDYRTNTVDSRDLGPVPLETVDGKVITILRRRGL